MRLNQLFLFVAALVVLLGAAPTIVNGQEVEADAPSDADAPVLPPTVVRADIDEEVVETVPYAPMEFSGTPFASPVAEGYLADSATTGTRVDVPLIDFPGSVQPITRQVMDEQQATNLFDVTRNVSGVYVGDGGGSVNDKIMLRGFEVDGSSNDFRKNGFRDSSRTKRGMANVERIEVLKGPASVLYGSAGQPSGIVNFITKKPLADFYHSARMRIGGFDDYRFTFDTTGPANDVGSILYRLNLAVQDADSFRDFVSRERYFISPVVQYQVDDATWLTCEFEYLNDYRVPDRGIPFYDGSFQAVPASRFLGEPTNRSRTNDGQVGVFLDHRVCPDVAWRVGYVSNWSEESRNVVEQKGDKVSGTEVKRRVKDDNTVDSDHYFIGDVTAEAHTGFLKHNVVVGTELGTTIRHKQELEGKGTNLDIFNPVYGQPQPDPDKLRLTNIQDDQYGLYAQDLIEIAPQLKGLVGLRWDVYQGNTFDTKVGPDNVGTSESVLSPRFGLVLQPIPEVFSMYAGYSESFAPQAGVTQLGSPFVPETGKMYEVGMKFELLERRLLLNFAGFDIFQQNLLVTDPDDNAYSIQVGSAESKGVEFDMVGQITDWWSILANCAYIDAGITNDTEASLLGNRLPNVPYFGFSVWTRCDLLECHHRSLAVATGVVYRGERQGDIDNSYQLPDYARWDAGLYYRHGQVRISLLAENLLNTFYVASGKSQVANIPGAPFNLVGTARIDY